MKKNKVEQNVQTKAWQEEQIIEVSFFDIDKPIELHYMEFTRNYTRVKGEIMKEQINMGGEAETDGDRTYTIKVTDKNHKLDGKELKVGKKFVN